MIGKKNSALKLAVPQIHHKLLPRKNVAAIIENATLAEAVCLIAPYGCGKTLAVVSWLRENNLGAAWITLDETDDSKLVLFADLSAAVLRHTGWQGVADDILRNPAYIEDPVSFFEETVLAAEKSSCDKIIVLDGLCFIREHSLLRAFKDTVAALLGRWRVIIISRNELPAVFNDLVLKRRICLITLKELGYSLEETTEFFRVNNCEASEHDVLRIYEETEGWPAALNVISTISRGEPVVYDEAAREYITGFFETEIWAGLSKNIRDFLLKTSVLDKLTPTSCNAVTDIGATLPILRWLFVNGLFVFKLNDTASYRYHRVFHDFLRNKLDALGLDRTELYKKAAWWLFERKEYEQSFPYFFKAGDLYGMSRVFRVINSAEIGLERCLELAGCITALNVDDLWGYPIIVAKMALINYALGNLSEMQRLYEIFLEWIEPGALPISPEDYAECVWEAGWLSYLNPDEPVLGNKHEEWLNYVEYDPELQTLHHNRAAVYRLPSILRGIRDYSPALDKLEEYLKQNKDSGYTTIGNEVSLLRLDIVRAEYAYELENFSLAEELIKTVMAEVEARQITDLYFICIALLVKIVRAAHNPREIGALSVRLEAMIARNGHNFLLSRFRAFEVRNRLADGIPGQTEVFAQENSRYMEKPYFYLMYRHMTLARALLSTDDFSEAMLLLNNLEHLCYQYNRVMDLIEVDILKSIAGYKLGSEESARRHVTKALDEARKYGFIRIFSDDAKDLWPVLELLEEGVKDDYVRSVIISCKKTLTRAGIKIRASSITPAKLTKTELKILRTLDSGLSYNELALDNGIKISTVKSHIRSIYSKLGVDNKTAAVTAARNMGIID